MSSVHVSASAAPELTSKQKAFLYAKQRELELRREADREQRYLLLEAERIPFLPPIPAAKRPLLPDPEDEVVSARAPKPIPPPRVQQTVQQTERPVEPPPELSKLVAATMQAAQLVLDARVRPRARARAKRVLAVLVEATYALIHARRQSQHATSYTWFTVLDLLPAITGLGHATCERALADLREAGLIASRRWYTRDRFLDKETGELEMKDACAGVWLCVVLRPTLDRRAFIHLHELAEAEAPRDLAADRKAGRTAWQVRKQAESEVRASSSQQEGKISIQELLRWALKIENPTTSNVEDSLSSAGSAEDVVWGLSALMSERGQVRDEAISKASVALARLYRDTHSVRHYRRLLTRAVAAEHAGYPAFAQLMHAMQRVLVDMTEINLSRPGGLLVREMKSAGWWDAVYRAA